MNRTRSQWIAVVVCAAFTALTGCGSDSGGATSESKKATEGLHSTRAQLAAAKTEVQQANAALDRLAAGGSLDSAYKQYTKEVADIRAAGARARTRAQDMRERQRQYVANWEKEMEQVTNAELKAGATARRAKVRENFDKITAAAHAARDAYQPYLKNLEDIQRALASDLTPGGVEAAKPAMAKAKTEGQTLEQRIDALLATLDEVSGSMSGSPPPPAAAPAAAPATATPATAPPATAPPATAK